MMKISKMKRVFITFIGLFLCFFFACNEEIDYEQILKDALQEIEIPSVLTDDFTFQKEVKINDYLISLNYETDNDALSTNGEIKRTENDVIVNITIIASINEHQSSKVVTTSIKALEIDYNDLLDKAIKQIIIPESITSNIDLLKSIIVDEHEITISYESDNDALTNNGKVKQTDSDETVKLKVIASINELQIEKVITVVVKAKEVDYDSILTKALEQIILPKSTKENIVFTSEVEINDYKIILEYVTSNDALTSDGVITRGESDISVDVSCIASLNGHRVEKKIDTIVVLAKENYQTINIYKDFEKLYVGDTTELTLDDGLSNDDYIWEVSDESVMMIDEWYFGNCLKAGSVTLTVTSKDSPYYGVVTFIVYNKIPILSLDNNCLVVGDTFKVDILNYTNNDDFNISISSSILEINDNTYTCLSTGEARITYSLKDNLLYKDEICESYLDIKVYEVKPLLFIVSTELVVGTVARIDIINYIDDNKYFIELSDNEIASIKGRLITTKKTGSFTVKVMLSNDPSIFSTLDITVIPVPPVLITNSSNILVGEKTFYYIKNLEELDNTTYDDYIVSTVDTDIIEINDREITGKAIGSAVIKVTLKSNEKVSNEYTINVVALSSKKDNNGEIGEGPLIISLKDNPISLKVGEMVKVNIEGGVSPDNYRFISGDVEYLNCLENGFIIPTKEGYGLVIVNSKTDASITGRLYVYIEGNAKVDLADRLIEVAAQEIGYKELPNLESKYGIWYGIPDGHWCAMFVTWCAHYAGISVEIIPFYCNCTAGSKWFIERNRFGLKGEYTPKKGDIVFFLSDGSSHTGIVINCVGNIVYTIEGNTSDMVAYRQYYLNDSKITGYGIPDYPVY